MPLAIETMDVVEVVRPIDSGMTEPFLCSLSDEHLYAVKGREALNRGLIAETVAASIGRQMGLPIPTFAFAELAADLAAETKAGARLSLNTGTNFASRWQEPVEVATAPLLLTYPATLLARLYVFDHWIKNGDRTLSEHGGNPNLLVKLENKALIAIDHNLAFSESYSPDELTFHAGRAAWLSTRSHGDFVADCRLSMNAALSSLSNILSLLPISWIEGEKEFLPYINETLVRFHKDAFWEELK